MYHVFRRSILALLLLAVFANHSWAANDQSFKEWLEQYGAWDRLEQEYAEESGTHTPQSVLKRAQVLLNLNSPQQALELIEMTPSFAEVLLEAKRLWIGGRAHRGLGNLTQAVLWFTQAAQSMTPVENSEKFSTEPGLEQIWKDVWLKMYWSYMANHTLSRDTQKEILDKILNIGTSVWGGDFWTRSHALMTGVPLEIPAETSPAPVMVTSADTDHIIQLLAALSLEEFDDAYAQAALLSKDPLRIFWSSIVVFMEKGTLPTNLEVFEKGNYLKAHAFWSGHVLAPFSKSRSPWFLGNPNSGPWTQFRNNLLNMPYDEANTAIDNELRSMLISEKTASLLNSFKFALALANNQKTSAGEIWKNIDKTALPLSLKVAGLLAFDHNPDAVLSDNPAESYKLYPTIASLSGAAGVTLHERTQAPFWTEAPNERLEDLAVKEYPLDKLLQLAYLRDQFTVMPTAALAKRAAFLFDDASFGIQGLLFLADKAVRNKHLQLGAYYLNKINEATLPANLRMSWLDIKTRLELDSGRTATALNTYKVMAKLGEPIPVMTRLRMALLFQQRNDYETAREELLAMWEQRGSMTTALQAETLFWLGEGEYAMKHTEKALDYYLKLAWQYPEENIWALTAMYRASLIYEKQGKYETAKKLLTHVAANASRETQREAARARMDAIDKKMGATNDASKSTLVYPF